MSKQFLGWVVGSLLLAGSIPATLTAEESSVEPVVSCGTDASGTCGGEMVLDQSCAWKVKAGILFLQRGGLPSQDLARGLGSAPNPVVDADQFGFGFEGGPDLTIVHHGDAADIEFRWFQVHDSTAETPTINSESMGFGFPFRWLLGVTGPDGVDLSARYISQLTSFELNLKRPITDRITVFGGFRYVEFDELLSYSATPVGDNHPVPLNAQSFNNLYGFQIGSDITVLDRGPFQLLATGKAGIYANSARNRAGGNGDPDFTDFASTSHAAFVGEIGLNGSYQITPRLAARIGYQVMWLDGVALASKQQPCLDPAHDVEDFGSPSVDTGGTAFYHGVLGGLDFRF
ncbi:MAG: hypothetical protein WCJ35_18535 [Planctomycetota bacterium]